MNYDPVKCNEDLTDSQSPTFIVCVGVIEALTSGGFTYSDSEVQTFCNAGCPTKIVTLFHSIETDCGIDPGQIVSETSMAA